MVVIINLLVNVLPRLCGHGSVGVIGTLPSRMSDRDYKNYIVTQMKSGAAAPLSERGQ
jgi:hypothetical protein